MKKYGFTLAEVLITLGIIGVVAALTAPALVQNAGTAKVGPTLSKVVSTIENANEQIMHDEDISNLDIIGRNNNSIATRAEDYSQKLSEYIQGSSIESNDVRESWSPTPTYYDGTNYPTYVRHRTKFLFSDNIDIFFGINSSYSYNPKGSFKGLYLSAIVDINSVKVKPNKFGKDIYHFLIDKSGQVIPMGSSTYAWLMDDETLKYTSEDGDYACNETKVGKGNGCAGSIFENNFKVIYQ